MKYTLYLIIGIWSLTCCTTGETEEPKVEEQKDHVSIATEICRQSRLYTTEYIVHKIVTHNDLRALKGSFLGMKFNHQLPLGDRKIAIPIDVTLQAYIDLSQITEKDIEVIKSEKIKVKSVEGTNSPSEEGEAIRITLPDPQIVVTSSKVDNLGVRTKVSWLRSNFTDKEMTNFTQQGVASVLRTVPQMGIIESAQQNAAALLIPLLADMGYSRENIVITFRKDFDEEDLRYLYDNEKSSVKLIMEN